MRKHEQTSALRKKTQTPNTCTGITCNNAKAKQSETLHQSTNNYNVPTSVSMSKIPTDAIFQLHNNFV